MASGFSETSKMTAVAPRCTALFACEKKDSILRLIPKTTSYLINYSLYSSPDNELNSVCFHVVNTKQSNFKQKSY